MKPRETFTAAYGIYPHKVDPADVVCTLKAAGFENDAICVVLARAHPIAEILQSARDIAGEDEESRASGSISWLSRLGAVVIPEVAFLIRSRTFLDALVTARHAALHGGSRTLAGLGFADADAERIEKQIKQGRFLIYVSSQESARSRWAVELLRATGAEETETVEKVAGAGAAA